MASTGSPACSVPSPSPGMDWLSPTTQQSSPASACGVTVYRAPEYSRSSAAFSAQSVSPSALRRTSRSRG